MRHYCYDLLTSYLLQFRLYILGMEIDPDPNPGTKIFKTIPGFFHNRSFIRGVLNKNIQDLNLTQLTLFYRAVYFSLTCSLL